jgi:short-subunit dehydrogenase
VVITGVTKGLGRALALEMATRGHVVAGCGRNEELLASLRSQIGSKHLLKVVDVVSRLDFWTYILEVNCSRKVLVAHNCASLRSETCHVDQLVPL